MTRTRILLLLVLTLALWSALALGLSSGVALERVRAPFGGMAHGGNGAFYSLVARNYHRYPLVALRGAMCIEPGARVAEPALYMHHPPMIGWLVWGSFALFGEGEWQARVVALGLTAVAIVLLFLLLREVFPGAPWAVFAGTALSALAPVWVFHASMPDPQGSGVLVSLCGALWFTARWMRRPVPRELWWAQGCLVFGYLFDWPAFLGAALIALCLWRSQLSGARRAGRQIASVALLSLVVLALWMLLGHRGRLPSLTEAFVGRTAAGLDVRFGVGFALMRILKHHLAGFCLPVVVLGWGAAIWLVLGRGRPAPHRLLLVPLGVGLLHVLLFLEGASIHDYWQIYLAPGLALPLAWAIDRLATSVRLRPKVQAAVVVLVAWSLWSAHLFATRAWRADQADAVVVKHLGATIKQLIPADRHVVTTQRKDPTLLYYSDRKMMWGTNRQRLPSLWQSFGDQIGGVLLADGDPQLGQQAVEALKGPFQIGRYRLWTWSGTR